MKVVYPVVLSKDGEGFVVFVPDCRINTEGEDLYDALVMARDAVSLWCVCEQDEGRVLPNPSEISAVPRADGDIVTLVDADLDVYRQNASRYADGGTRVKRRKKP